MKSNVNFQVLKWFRQLCEMPRLLRQEFVKRVTLSKNTAAANKRELTKKKRSWSSGWLRITVAGGITAPVFSHWYINTLEQVSFSIIIVVKCHSSLPPGRSCIYIILMSSSVNKRGADWFEMVAGWAVKNLLNKGHWHVLLTSTSHSLVVSCDWTQKCSVVES